MLNNTYGKQLFQNESSMRRGICFTFLKISLTSGLTENSWVLISASAVSLILCVLVKVYEEN